MKTSKNEPSPANDPAIRSAIDAWLGQQDDLDPQQVQVLVDTGVVMLLGEVPDYRAKQEMKAFVLGVRGVREVHDQLLVSDTSARDSAGLRTDAPGQERARRFSPPR
jgi:osmotically-inducible protein OsmY